MNNFFTLNHNAQRVKYFILLVSFLIMYGAWFERFVLLTTSFYRGQMPASWASFYPGWPELPVFLFLFFLKFIPFVLLLVNIVADIRRFLKKKL